MFTMMFTGSHVCLVAGDKSQLSSHRKAVIQLLEEYLKGKVYFD